MKTTIVTILIALLFASCVGKTTESWHPHQHKSPKAYKRK